MHVPTFASGRTVRQSAAFSRLDLTALAVCLSLLGLGALPTLGQAKAKSKRIQCLSNLEGIARGFRTFALDHDDQFPMAIRVSRGGTSDYLGTSSTAGAAETWTHVWAVRSHLESTAILLCPSDVARYAPVTWEEMASRPAARNFALSYGIGTGAKPDMPRMLLLADRSLTGTVGTTSLQFDRRSVRLDLGTNTAVLSGLGWDGQGLHRSAGNVARADGSVHLMNSESLRQLLIESGDSRNNYAQPGRL